MERKNLVDKINGFHLSFTSKEAQCGILGGSVSALVASFYIVQPWQEEIAHPDLYSNCYIELLATLILGGWALGGLLNYWKSKIL